MSEEFDSAARIVPRYEPAAKAEPVRIRVIPGSPIGYELVVDGYVRDMTRIEVIELIMNAASSLRY